MIKPVTINLPLEDKNYISLLEIEKVVREITKLDIRIKTRKREYINARGLFYLFACEFTITSVTHIARFIDMHHSSVLYHKERMPYTIAQDPQLEMWYLCVYNSLTELVKIKKATDGEIEYVDIYNIFEKVEYLLNEVKKLKSTIDEHKEL
tara:strand:- start:1403 stop:1855 length:453 start_codon:yes stop_codon:yes gene_type:complete